MASYGFEFLPDDLPTNDEMDVLGLLHRDSDNIGTFVDTLISGNPEEAYFNVINSLDDPSLDVYTLYEQTDRHNPAYHPLADERMPEIAFHHQTVPA